MNTINVKIIQRTDTSENWDLHNPILDNGEIGYDIDKKTFKIGNGSSTWTSLPYYNEIIDGGDYIPAKSPAMLAKSDTWYKGSVARSTITSINIVDSADDATIATADESWAAGGDFNKDGENDDSVMCYVNGTELTIAGNGSGKIYMNYDSSWAFSDHNRLDYFNNVKTFSNADLFDTSKVNNMERLFFEANSIEYVDVADWDTSNVTNMAFTFGGGPYSQEIGMSFTSLDLKDWDTSNVTTMKAMFQYCKKLETLDVSNWDTGKVTDMFVTFSRCESLKELDVADWDTSSVTNMSGTFQHCIKLETLDVSNWDTSSVTTMGQMFNFADARGALSNLDVSNWNTSKVTDMQFMFYGANKLGTLDVRNWNTSKVKNFDHMFAHTNVVLEGGEEALKNWITDSATNMYGMFHSVQNTVLDVSKFNTSKVTVFGEMFEQCNKLTKIIGLENFDTSKGVGFRDMFNKCYKLKELDLSSFDTSKATYGITVSTNKEKSDSTHWMFNECRALEKVILGPKFDFDGDGTTKTNYYPAIFPTPSSTYITGADGYWYTEDGIAYTAAEIQAMDNSAGTYYASINLIPS